MSNAWKEVDIPQISVNDEFVVLVRWLVTDGEKVYEGDIIAELETSKSLVELASEGSGYIFSLVREGEKVIPGTKVAIISEKNDSSVVKEYTQPHYGNQETKSTVPEGFQLTKKAEELALELKIDFSRLPKGQILRERDILEYSKKPAPHQHCDKKTFETPAINNNGNQIVIIGGGGHAKMCIDILKQMNLFEIYGIIDKDLEVGEQVLGIPVVGKDEDLSSIYNKGIRLAVNGIGAATNHSIRGKIFRKLKDIGFTLPNLIHPKAAVEPSVKMGEGNQIMANSVIGSDARIGNNCIINSGAVVSHDSVLKDNVHITPGAILAGKVVIGCDTLIGMGSTVYQNLQIGNNVTVFNGLNIIQDIKDNEVLKK